LGNYGFWAFGDRNGLEGAESKVITLTGGRVQTIKDPKFPAVLEDSMILFSTRSSLIAQRDMIRLLPTLDSVSKNRIDTLLAKNPYLLKILRSHQDYEDYVQSKQVSPKRSV
jgi:hypothetical protein